MMHGGRKAVRVKRGCWTIANEGRLEGSEPFIMTASASSGHVYVR